MGVKQRVVVLEKRKRKGELAACSGHGVLWRDTPDG